MLALFFRGLALWLGYLGCSAMDYWDSLYFLGPPGPVRLRQSIPPLLGQTLSARSSGALPTNLKANSSGSNRIRPFRNSGVNSNIVL